MCCCVEKCAHCLYFGSAYQPRNFPLPYHHSRVLAPSLFILCSCEGKILPPQLSGLWIKLSLDCACPRLGKGCCIVVIIIILESISGNTSFENRGGGKRRKYKSYAEESTTRFALTGGKWLRTSVGKIFTPPTPSCGPLDRHCNQYFQMQEGLELQLPGDECTRPW